MKMFRRMLSLFTVIIMIACMAPGSALAAGRGDGRTGDTPAPAMFAAAAVLPDSIPYTQMQYEPVTLPFSEMSSLGLPDDGSEFISDPEEYDEYARGYRIELTKDQRIRIDINAEFETYNFLLSSVTGEQSQDVIKSDFDNYDYIAKKTGTYYIIAAGSVPEEIGNFTISVYDPDKVRTEPLDFTGREYPHPGPGSPEQGWTWDEETQTLTLNGLYLDLSGPDMDFAVSLPENSKIVLNGTNVIKYGMYTGIECRGELQIIGDGSLFIYYGGDIDEEIDPGAGIVTDGGLTISGCGTIYAEGYMGMCVVNPYIEDNPQNIGPNLMNADMTQPGTGIMAAAAEDEALPDLVIQNCGNVVIESIKAGFLFNNVSILNCGRVTVNKAWFDPEEPIDGPSEPAAQFGIMSIGETLISNCDLCSITASIIGISSGSGISIRNSSVEAFGNVLGVASGVIMFSEEGPGGDIVIDNSTVRASCGNIEEAGIAAIFAGDDVFFGGEGRHSRIILIGSVLKEPKGGRILNVEIDGKRCQSVTDLTGIPAITGYEQFASSVLFVPNKTDAGKTFTVSYHPNGGMGTLPMDFKRYYPGDKAALLPGAGLSNPGYVFLGWSLSDSGKPINDLTIGNTDVTLFAVWGEAEMLNVPKTGDEASGFGWIMLAAGLAVIAFVSASKRRKAKA